MADLVCELHSVFHTRRRFHFPFAHLIDAIPQNGIYIIFERGETYRTFDRIVRVGTHTGQDQLRSRLKQHFIKPNKNRSIFRKNIRRSFLYREGSAYLPSWELDVTSRVDRQRNLEKLDLAFEANVEKRISEYIQANLSFCVFEVQEKEERLFWESRIVSTIARSGVCSASPGWLGNYSPKAKIVQSGLWQVNELEGQVLSLKEWETLKKMLSKG